MDFHRIPQFSADKSGGPRIYTCKLHAHPYTVCGACAHQYCAIYWRSCPRCNGNGARNRYPQPQADGADARA